MATVRRQVQPDVAAGEYSWSLADSARLIDAGAVDCLQLDVTRCGGITEFVRGAALAAARLTPECDEHHITVRLFASGRAHPTRP